MKSMLQYGMGFFTCSARSEKEVGIITFIQLNVNAGKTLM